MFVLLFMVFSRPKLYCAELGLAIGCHGDTQQPRKDDVLEKKKKSSAQVKSKRVFILSSVAFTLTAVRPHVTCCTKRDLVTVQNLLATTEIPKYIYIKKKKKRSVTAAVKDAVVQFH